MVLFDAAKRLDHGTPNPIVARLTVQPSQVLNQCKISEANERKFLAISMDELVKRLLRCWEIERYLTAEAERCRAAFKPPAPGDASIEIPQIVRLKEECENFLYEAKNFLRDALQLFNLLWGTEYEDASEWVNGKKKRPSAQEFMIGKFGAIHVNSVYIRQFKPCYEPLILMRNAVEHPNPSVVVLKNFTRDGRTLVEPTWTLEKDGKPEYGPFVIIDEMRIYVRNLLVWGEDLLVMWAVSNLVAPHLVEVRYVPEERRNPQCPIKYKVLPTDAVLEHAARSEAAKRTKMVAGV